MLIGGETEWWSGGVMECWSKQGLGRARVPARREDVPNSAMHLRPPSRQVLGFGNSPAAAGRGRDPSQASVLSDHFVVKTDAFA